MEIVNVIGYEGLYCVTSEGEIYSLKRGVKLSVSNDSGGYEKVSLCKNGTRKSHKVHKIVFDSFNRRKKNLVIDHIDGDRTNNKLSNLRQITTRENTSRAKVNRFGRGVHYFEKINKYGSEITIEKERFYLGSFDSADDASLAYKEALRKWEEEGKKPTKKDKSKKLCKVCNRVLDINNFYYIKGHGYSWSCKECSRKYSKERRKAINE